MSLAIERLIKNARIALPGSIDSAIQLELFNVLDQFFRDSSIWSEDIGFTVLRTDLAGTVYYIEPEAVAAIVRLFGVFNDVGIRQNAVMQVPGEVTLLLPPSDSSIFVASVALSVIDPVQPDGYPAFPAWILDKYRGGLLDGLLGRMMAQPAKPYTNLQLAVAHLAAFRRAISFAATEAIHLNVHNAQGWAFPQQFSTRSRRR